MHKRKTERFRCLQLTPVNRKKTSSLNLREIGASVKRHADQNGLIGIQSNANFRQCEVDEEDLYKLWCVGEETYVNICEGSKDTAPVDFRGSSKKANHHASTEGQEGDLEAKPRTNEQIRHVT